MPDDAGRTMVCFIDLPLTATDVKEEVGAMAEAVDYLASALSNSMSFREGIPSPSRSSRGVVMIFFRSMSRPNSRSIEPCA